MGCPPSWAWIWLIPCPSSAIPSWLSSSCRAGAAGLFPEDVRVLPLAFFFPLPLFSLPIVISIYPELINVFTLSIGSVLWLPHQGLLLYSWRWPSGVHAVIKQSSRSHQVEAVRWHLPVTRWRPLGDRVFTAWPPVVFTWKFYIKISQRSPAGCQMASWRTPTRDPTVSKNWWRPNNQQTNFNSKLKSTIRRWVSYRRVLDPTDFHRATAILSTLGKKSHRAITHGSIFMNWHICFSKKHPLTMKWSLTLNRKVTLSIGQVNKLIWSMYLCCSSTPNRPTSWTDGTKVHL